MSKVLKMADAIGEWSGKIFSSLIPILMLVVLTEVAMRYVFNNPTIWTYETSTFIFGAAFMLGGAYTLIHKGHVKVDILYTRLSPRTRAIMDVVTFVFFLIFISIILWKGGDMVWKAFHSMERSGSSWNPVVWPSRLFIPIGAFLILLQGLAGFIRNIAAIVRREEA